MTTLRLTLELLIPSTVSCAMWPRSSTFQSVFWLTGNSLVSVLAYKTAEAEDHLSLFVLLHWPGHTHNSTHCRAHTAPRAPMSWKRVVGSSTTHLVSCRHQVPGLMPFFSIVFSAVVSGTSLTMHTVCVPEWELLRLRAQVLTVPAPLPSPSEGQNILESLLLKLRGKQRAQLSIPL